MENIAIVLVPLSAVVLLALCILSGISLIAGAEKWPSFYKELASMYDSHFADQPFIRWWGKVTVGATDKIVSSNKYRSSGYFIVLLGIIAALLALFWLYATLNTPIIN